MCGALQVPTPGEESDWPSIEKIGAISVELEAAMDSEAPQLTAPRDYMIIVKRLLFNLQSNSDLRCRVARGKMPAYVVVMLDPKELASQDVKQMRDDAWEFDKGVRRSNWKQAHAMEMAIAAGVKNAGISMYKCPRCRSRRVNSFAMQTRCADEPMTIFCTCLDCMKAFRR
jgi:transcription elongation factor S-II